MKVSTHFLSVSSISICSSDFSFASGSLNKRQKNPKKQIAEYKRNVPEVPGVLFRIGNVIVKAA
jgi:hypothetical protein